MAGTSAAGTPATGWIATVAGMVKPSTWYAHAGHGKVHLLPALGHLEVRHLTRAHVRAFVTTRRTKQLSDGSVRVVYAVFG